VAWDVVIAGGGFGGAHAARRLERLLPKQSARLILVNDVNFLLYTPFLPEAAAGTLEPRHVVTPLREILRRTNLRLGAVTAHDPAARTVEITAHDGEVTEQRYDQLLLALGSVSRLLPVPGLERAIGFKSLADAIWLRNHVIETLEAANAAEDPDRRRMHLTYVFVGGGYAGLEALAALQDFAADAMDRYPRARLQGMRWILVEATDRVLPEIDPKLADYAVRELRGRGIEVRLGTRLEALDPDLATLSTGERIPTRTVVWTTGVMPHPSLHELSVPLDAHGRVVVDRYLRVDGMEGRTAAHNIAAELGVGSSRPFRYRNRGAFVNLGRYKAVARVGPLTLSGFPAWWLARTYHLSQISGVTRKVRATVDWTVGLPFARDVAELGSIGHPRPLRAEEYLRGGSHRPVA
jgi:NADH dehydrogenase